MTEEAFEKASKIMELIKEKKRDVETLNHAIMLLGNNHPGFSIRCDFDFPEAQFHLLTWEVQASNQVNLETFLKLEATTLNNQITNLESTLSKL